MEHKYSIFQTEKRYHEGLSYVGEFGSVTIEKCFILLGTFDELLEAKLKQEYYDFRTIIVATY